MANGLQRKIEFGTPTNHSSHLCIVSLQQHAQSAHIIYKQSRALNTKHVHVRHAMSRLMLRELRLRQKGCGTFCVHCRNALVFTLDQACAHSQLQEPTQFIRVVQVGLSPPWCPYWLPARSPHRRARLQEGTIFHPDFGPRRALRGNSSSFDCSNKSKWIDIGPYFSGWVGSRPKCLLVE